MDPSNAKQAKHFIPAKCFPKLPLNGGHNIDLRCVRPRYGYIRTVILTLAQKLILTVSLDTTAQHK